MYLLTVFVVCSLVQPFATQDAIREYIILRNKILEDEARTSVGGNLNLTRDEQEANEVLMAIKRNMYDDVFHSPDQFKFSKHYFTYKDHIESSQMYKILKKMPKGAALHLHSNLMLDPDSLMDLTYEEEDYLYVCYGDNVKFRFSETVPTSHCAGEWALIKDLRESAEDVKIFDAQLKRHLSINSEDEEEQLTDINSIWAKFEKVCNTIKSLTAYRPIKEIYFSRSLEKAYADNIMYFELRAGLSSVYELNGTVHDPIFTPQLIKRLTESFKATHPDFMGIKLILAIHRKKSNQAIRKSIEFAKRIKHEMPDIFAGFDLVGQEDLGRPLLDFVPTLLEAQNEIDYYFHAGETLWFGTSVDNNLVDAILMGTRRIGHAYSLLKHPNLQKFVVKRKIALEINVISNGVLCLTRDVRNHPLASYLALGLPVVLSSDDPSVWGADMLSHDFYVAFVAIASRNYDLRLLKQLALNSIRYSALDPEDKTKFFKIFNRRWKVFIDYLKEVKCEACDK